MYGDIYRGFEQNEGAQDTHDKIGDWRRGRSETRSIQKNITSHTDGPLTMNVSRQGGQSGFRRLGP